MLLVLESIFLDAKSFLHDVSHISRYARPPSAPAPAPEFVRFFWAAPVNCAILGEDVDPDIEMLEPAIPAHMVGVDMIEVTGMGMGISIGIGADALLLIWSLSSASRGPMTIVPLQGFGGAEAQPPRKDPNMPTSIEPLDIRTVLGAKAGKSDVLFG